MLSSLSDMDDDSLYEMASRQREGETGLKGRMRQWSTLGIRSVRNRRLERIGMNCLEAACRSLIKHRRHLR
jgi:hypothetical protein